MNAGTPSDTGRPRVDVRDMLVVHTAMLREFRLAPAAVRRTTHQRRQVERVADHVRFLCDLLHHHHQGEDELLWPRLRERTGPDAQHLIAEVEAQHESIDDALDEVEQLRTTWVRTCATETRDQLADALHQLHAVLREHLDLEERDLLPLAADVLSVPEWHAVGEAGAAAIPKPDLPLVFGMFAYEGDPAVLATMLSGAPLPVRVLVPRIAPRVYARRARRIHGTSRP